MANRTFQQKQLTLIKRKVELWAAVAVGAAGAVTLKKTTYINGAVSTANATTSGTGYDVGNGEGVRAVSRTGVGAWTVTLSDAYMLLKGVEISETSNTTGLPTAAQVGVVSGSTNVATNTSLGNGGVIALQFVDFAGVAVDPASGDTITLKFTLQDASEP
jgi:hypothetical protein